ncbi:hypothetical protein [Paenibacillus bouchesdurhonensis]|uniref:hypothetical protein n=1 Tax=Paenibacillus bouchesdurhonensis TaxID=1870990 RepID=UPI0019022473|nr:hypothetical protein [Paenibacillus bouchesdurhonensis]
MAYDEVLERRNELLRRQVGEMLAKENQYGLKDQESHFLRRMIKELHQTEFELSGKSL